MGCRVSGRPGFGPKAISVRQSQSRVRMVTTQSRVVPHALDLMPLPPPSRSEDEDGDKPGIRETMHQMIAQLGTPNRLFWEQVQGFKLALPVDQIRRLTLGAKGERYRIPAGWMNVQQVFFLPSWGNWFAGGSRDDQDLVAPINSHIQASSSVAQADDSVVTDTATGEKGIEPEKKAPPPDIWRFLKPVSVADTKVVRVMASLSDLTYLVAKVTPRSLFRRHSLNLVASSTGCKDATAESQGIEDAMNLADGMAVAPDLNYSSNERENETEMSNIVATTVDDEVLGPFDPAGFEDTRSASSKPMWHGTTQLAAKVATSMGSAASEIYSQAMAQVARQVYQAMMVGQSAVHLTVAQVLSLVQAALAVGMKKKPTKERVKPEKCPTEWFVCDHEPTNTRIFCIQGSDNMESWQANLAFDPVTFEDESLGVRIHRGVYNVAEMLYQVFVPLIREHLLKNPGAKISMTGHSLGGSLATALTLMLVFRGVLPPEAVDHVYTFGAAASFCDAASCGGDCSNCGHNCPGRLDHDGCSVPKEGLLEKLGLSSDSVIDTIMHKDIVPRAFACDYSPVAVLLRNLGGNFREHCCLQHDRSLLYSFIGEVFVLQPEANRKYVKNDEGYHPQLPQGAGLFQITEATKGLTESVKWRRTGEVSGCVESQKEAILSFMDNPHPLEILGDAKAYGELGTISRYHNPAHYKNALGSVLSVYNGAEA